MIAVVARICSVWLSGSTTVSGNATYVAQWEPDPELTYTVSYSAVNGTVSTEANNDIQILTTEGVTGSTATANEGYKFDGWYKGEDKISDTLTLSAADAVANLNKTNAGNYADTEYVAKFVVDDEQIYTVTYSAVNGSVDPTSQTEQILATTAITGSTATANEGYKFDGWYKGEDKISGEETLTAEIAVANLNKTNAGNYADTEYVAKFVVDDSQTYTVTYTSAGNGSVDPTRQTEQILATTAITGSTATPAPGYKFDGWYKDNVKIEGAAATMTSAIAVENLNKTSAGNNGDTEYVAKFVIDDEPTYTVRYNAVNGTVDTPENPDIQVLSTEGVTGSTATFFQA